MFKVIDLPYSKNALSPYMSEESVEFHYEKHHKGYMNFVNNFVSKDASLQDKNLEDLIKISSQDAKLTSLFNNASQLLNHNEFFPMMKKDISVIPTLLKDQINKDFGSIDAFKKMFIDLGKSLFGSGWIWLVYNNGKLEIRQYPNGGNPIPDGLPIVLGCDVWEHSYYIDYRNRRPDYLQNFVDHLINWEYVGQKFDRINR